MAMKPNYRFQRAERDRLKQAKKAAKLQRQQDRSPAEPVDERNLEPARLERERGRDADHAGAEDDGVDAARGQGFS